MAVSPPAITPCTISGFVRKVGGHSDASSTQGARWCRRRIKEPPAGPQSVNRHCDGLHNRMLLFGDGRDGDGILSQVHQRDGIGNAHRVEILRLGKSLLGKKV